MTCAYLRAAQFNFHDYMTNMTNIVFWQEKSYPQIYIQKGNKKRALGPRFVLVGYMANRC